MLSAMERDAQWISEIKKENRGAFRAVYDHYADKIFYVSLRFHLSEDEAKEMVQAVFLKLWEKRESLKEHLSLNAFLLTITKNNILNLHKRKAVELAGMQTYLKYQPTSASTTEDYLSFSELENCTLRFINSLPSRHKQIFLLSRKEGMKNEEIASQLNLSKRTVENNIYQAELAIRQFLKKNKILERSFVFLTVWIGL
ncbi:RNA polymerase sigma-70 factor (family 1) [Catalinimonas alkaloidigena]|uniref:RNA polymerase sigma-70 factor n=1 Tax=Catalinimonas alkaloidigena TaxID=1075417 RepID=UPI002405DF96|nr:RNA polymerase sigma-70 factor [Catalinimonas alkaloidigena]MDF9798717.1 RNA polymerase sigma-70 factor (family 1) [Catalinimonas alkaloidigena]